MYQRLNCQQGRMKNVTVSPNEWNASNSTDCFVYRLHMCAFHSQHVC